ncbi:MAG: CDP-alcohol phosphatidyltransferase family protein [Patescibacteria group bacterium]|jgi:CDP-diacylglycerol--glycerol-3-phosphate 3-phosphatidyltransferase
MAELVKLMFGTIPNLLSISRIILTLFILNYIFDKKMAIAGILYTIAALTDWLDGYLARRFNHGSEIGKILDIAADKILVLFPLFLLVRIGVWKWLVALIFCGEIGVILGRLMVNSTPKLQEAAEVKRSGKIKAALQYAAIALVILGVPYPNFVMGIAAFFTVWSGLDYLRTFFRLCRAQAP